MAGALDCLGQRLIRSFALPAGACSFTATAVSACMVCIELPEVTLTDQLWAADTVVFARPSAENAFKYAATSTLRGRIEDPIPFLVSSAARRQFDRNEDIAALVLRMPDGTWDLRGLGGSELVEFAKVALQSERAWTDQANDPDRALAFRDMHDHSSPNLRRLALTELSRFPYIDLKSMDVGLSPDWIAERLFDVSWIAWQPILVHLLGLHRDPRAHEFIRQHALKIREEDRLPWLVALIEVEGEAGVQRILANTLQTDQPAQARLAAVQALTIHAEATPQLSPSLTAALRHLIADDAELAAFAAEPFLRRRDFSLAADAEAILSKGGVRDPASAFVLKHYVTLARTHSAGVLSQSQ